MAQLLPSFDYCVIYKYVFCPALLAGILCEYGVLALNMLYHHSAVYEFSDHSWHVLVRRKLF